MKSFRFFAIVLSITLLFCTPKKKNISQTANVSVVVSIPPQKYFVDAIGGSNVSTTCLLPPGASPHTFEPKPAHMVQLAQADCYFTIGLELEKAWRERITTLNPTITIVETDRGIRKKKEERKERHHDHHNGEDPHIWLAPSLVKRQALTITEALCGIDSIHAEYYRSRLSAFRDSIDTVSAEIQDIIKSCGSNRTFLVFHPSWRYFAEEFGLRQLAVEADGGEPTFRELKQVIHEAKENEITKILIQPQFSRVMADRIAQQMGATVTEADPMAGAWADNLRTVAQRICQ